MVKTDNELLTREIIDRLARIETKQDGIAERFNKQTSDVDKLKGDMVEMKTKGGILYTGIAVVVSLISAIFLKVLFG